MTNTVKRISTGVTTFPPKYMLSLGSREFAAPSPLVAAIYTWTSVYSRVTWPHRPTLASGDDLGTRREYPFENPACSLRTNRLLRRNNSIGARGYRGVPESSLSFSRRPSLIGLSQYRGVRQPVGCNSDSSGLPSRRRDPVRRKQINSPPVPRKQKQW